MRREGSSLQRKRGEGGTMHDGPHTAALPSPMNVHPQPGAPSGSKLQGTTHVLPTSLSGPPELWPCEHKRISDIIREGEGAGEEKKKKEEYRGSLFQKMC